MSLIFENEGVIDLRAIKTFGISAKKDDTAIGMFGTGLKYAIAIFLREGYEVLLVADGEAYRFEKKDVEVRGKNFQILTMNDEELPFTTHLGSTWKLWQGFREIYCNCLDEGGKVYSGDIMSNDVKGKTFFMVRGAEAQDLYEKRDTIVLPETKKYELAAGNVKIYSESGKCIYYRGIRAFDIPQPTLFSYNITSPIELTEDRTIKNPMSAMNTIARNIGQMNNKTMIREILTAEEPFMERRLDFHDSIWDLTVCSPEFREVVENLYKRNSNKLNESARRLYMKYIMSRKTKNYEDAELSELQNKKLDKALKAACAYYPKIKEYKVRVVKTLGENVYGKADKEDEYIVLSESCIDMSTKFLVSTIIEEYVHLETGFDDLTRNLQTYLFDEITTMIEKFVVKEPM